MVTRLLSLRALGRLVAGAVLAGAMLVGFAPAAHAWHPDSFASVECTDDGIVLTWRAVSWMGDNFWGPDYYNSDVRVYLQYGTADAPIGGLTDTQIGAGAFTDTSLAFDGSLVLSPPDGATRVRVHSDALALWASGNATIPHEAQTTEWMVLPLECNELPEETTTTTAPPPSPPAETTTTTVVEEPAVESTTTTTPVAVLSGSAEAPTQVVPAQAVATQAAPTQTLPNTGSSTGVLAAAAVLLIALGGGAYAAGRRTPDASRAD